MQVINRMNENDAYKTIEMLISSSFGIHDSNEERNNTCKCTLLSTSVNTKGIHNVSDKVKNIKNVSMMPHYHSTQYQEFILTQTIQLTRKNTNKYRACTEIS